MELFIFLVNEASSNDAFLLQENNEVEKALCNSTNDLLYDEIKGYLLYDPKKHHLKAFRSHLQG